MAFPGKSGTGLPEYELMEAEPSVRDAISKRGARDASGEPRLLCDACACNRQSRLVPGVWPQQRGVAALGTVSPRRAGRQRRRGRRRTLAVATERTRPREKLRGSDGDGHFHGRRSVLVTSASTGPRNATFTIALCAARTQSHSASAVCMVGAMAGSEPAARSLTPGAA